jgi:hypothetical protein
MDPKLRQRFTGTELEVRNSELAWVANAAAGDASNPTATTPPWAQVAVP